MRLFNSFQIVSAFVAWPFLVSWLRTDPFHMAGVLSVTAFIVYLIGFGAMVRLVYDSLDERRH